METLVDEVVEEILLRLPPGDPVSLLRAATVCRSWCRIISATGFRRRFGQRHVTAPMLGLLANLPDPGDGRWDCSTVRFVPATPFRPRRFEHRPGVFVDSRHGRVLLSSADRVPDLVVWDPVTDELRELPELPVPLLTWTAAVLCANYGACDHLVCRPGPFFVVVLLEDPSERFRVYIYSSEAGAWSQPRYGPPSPEFGTVRLPGALVGDTLCFMIDATHSILRYNLATRDMSVIDFPLDDFISDSKVLMTMGDGELGFAMVEESTLWVCSMQTDPKGESFWVPVRSIELGFDADFIDSDCLTFAPGVEVFYVRTMNGCVSIDLKSGRVREQVYCNDSTDALVPYMNFYTPDLQQYGVVPRSCLN